LGGGPSERGGDLLDDLLLQRRVRLLDVEALPEPIEVRALVAAVLELADERLPRRSPHRVPNSTRRAESRVRRAHPWFLSACARRPLCRKEARMRTSARLLLAAALVALPVTLLAQPVDMGTEPYTLEGIVAKDQANAQAIGWFPLSIGIVGSEADPERWIGATAFKTWNDDPFVGRQVLRNLMPADPNMLFAGPSSL